MVAIHPSRRPPDSDHLCATYIPSSLVFESKISSCCCSLSASAILTGSGTLASLHASSVISTLVPNEILCPGLTKIAFVAPLTGEGSSAYIITSVKEGGPEQRDLRRQ